MKRIDFLKGLGIAGLSTALPINNMQAAVKNFNFLQKNACVLIPSETEGPFPLDLTENPTYFRQDIRENKTGVQLNLKLRVIGLSNCEPMQNVRVNIWHCDKDGLYSGYSQTNNQGQAGLTYLRGYQLTDANGEVNFTTIFPGWYSGRICHIHFQVYISSVYRAVSQLTFDMDAKNALYEANSSIYTKGIDPLTFQTDNIFSDGYSYQVASLSLDSSTGIYNSFLELSVQGSGTTTGLGALEPETGGQFRLLQNYPNPFINECTVPFLLTNDADVELKLFDLNANEVYSERHDNLLAGKHEIKLNFNSINIHSQNLIYQLEIKNNYGTYRQCKMMTKK